MGYQTHQGPANVTPLTLPVDFKSKQRELALTCTLKTFKMTKKDRRETSIALFPARESRRMRGKTATGCKKMILFFDSAVSSIRHKKRLC